MRTFKVSTALLYTLVLIGCFGGASDTFLIDKQVSDFVESYFTQHLLDPKMVPSTPGPWKRGIVISYIFHVDTSCTVALRQSDIGDSTDDLYDPHLWHRLDSLGILVDDYAFSVVTEGGGFMWFGSAPHAKILRVMKKARYRGEILFRDRTGDNLVHESDIVLLTPEVLPDSLARTFREYKEVFDPQR